MQLNNNTLPHFDKGLHIPSYNRSAVKQGIVHIGIGNFHRSHQAYIIDRYMDETKSLDLGYLCRGTASAG